MRCVYPRAAGTTDTSSSVSETSRKRDPYKSFVGYGTPTEPLRTEGEVRSAVSRWRPIPNGGTDRSRIFPPYPRFNTLARLFFDHHGNKMNVGRTRLLLSAGNCSGFQGKLESAGECERCGRFVARFVADCSVRWMHMYRRRSPEPRSAPAAPSQNENSPHFDDISLRIVSSTVNRSVFVKLNSVLQRDHTPNQLEAVLRFTFVLQLNQNDLQISSSQIR